MEWIDNLADARDRPVQDFAVPPSIPPVGQGKGQTSKKPTPSTPPGESSPTVVAGPAEGAISEASPNISSRIEEWAEVVGGGGVML